jgi:class 3 adenylate cyclase
MLPTDKITSMSELPAGTVTFLFTDIEGSTPLWERNSQAMREALSRHNTLLQTAIQQHEGHVFQIVGDAFHAAFSLPIQALEAALDAQRLSQRTLGNGPLQVRMGIHTAGPKSGGSTFQPRSEQVAVSRLRAWWTGVDLADASAAGEHLPEDVNLEDRGSIA